MRLNRVEAPDQLVGDLLGLDPTLGEPAYPQFPVGQRVGIDILAPLPAMRQLEFVARFFRKAFGATRSCQLDGLTQEGPGGTILARPTQERAEPMAESGLEQQHAARRGQVDGLLEQAPHRLEVTLELFEGGAAPSDDDPRKAAGQTL